MKNKKQVVNTAGFRGTGGFCVLDFWPFSSSFSNKDVTRFNLLLVFFLKQEKLTTNSNGVTFFFLNTKVTNVK